MSKKKIQAGEKHILKFILNYSFVHFHFIQKFRHHHPLTHIRDGRNSPLVSSQPTAEPQECHGTLACIGDPRRRLKRSPLGGVVPFRVSA